MPSHGLTSVRPVDYLENEPARIWLLTDDRSDVHRSIVGLFNWSDSESTLVDISLDRLGLSLSQRYVGFDYWFDQFVAPFKGRLRIDLPPASCRILSLRSLTDYPLVVSTSRHITQGIIDLIAESWNRNSGILTGTSHLVAGDPYELRIFVPVQGTSWKARKVELLNAPESVKSSFSQEGPMIRMTINSPNCAEVQWAVHFEPGAVDAPNAGVMIFGGPE